MPTTTLCLRGSLTVPAPWWRKSRQQPDLDWLSRHSWAWDPARLDELIRAAAPATLYVCGGADNELELADRFTHVFLLEIDEPTMLARLDARRDYHDWGRIGDTREYLRRKLPDIPGPLARIRGDPHRRQAAPRPGGGRDTLPHAARQALEPRTRRARPLTRTAMARDLVVPGRRVSCCCRAAGVSAGSLPGRRQSRGRHAQEARRSAEIASRRASDSTAWAASAVNGATCGPRAPVVTA